LSARSFESILATIPSQRQAIGRSFQVQKGGLDVNITTQFAFAVDALGHMLEAVSNETLDQLDFGVVEMNHEGTVLRYNKTESQYSGLPPDRVVGRDFFHHVAPCSNNQRVAERYRLSSLDETINYTFSFRMKPVPVALRMIKVANGSRMYLLVRWL
jgi:photoactive yellow protein